MPWYTYDRVVSKGESTTSFNNIIVQPFIYNNVIIDYDNLINYTTNIRYDYNQVSEYTVIIGSIGWSFYNYSFSSSKRYVGFPCLIYSKNQINSTLFTETPTTFINGRYKLKNNIISFPKLELENGITLPVKININGKSFKYLIVSSSNTWEHGDYGSGKFIGGYNTPSDFNKIKTPPSDFTTYKIAIGNTINLDFGNNNQEVPQFFYDWFIAQFDKIYENTYTIKSTTGSTLTTLTEAPPMTSATLSTVGNAKYLTLKGENNTNYTMEWTSETPQGKIFAGLAASKGGSIVIPVGETSTINLTESTDLYEVWQTYRPPTTTFEIKTYNYSGETSRVDKTDYLTPISALSGVLRGEASLLNFNVLIQSDTVPNFNYCYIDKFKRYYYVTEPVSVRQNLWEMTMQVDALMTYKDSLLKCEGYIDRNEYIQNKMIIDNNRAIMQGADFEEDTITNELFGSGTFALSGLRIGTKELP